MKRIGSAGYVLIVAALIFTMFWIDSGKAQENKKEKLTAKVKEMVGEVVYFTPRNNPTVICIGHEATNTDYSFLIDEDTKVAHKNSLSDINVGDTVKVVYYQIMKMDKRRGEVEERIAKMISFVRAKKKEVRPKSDAEDEAETEALVSE